MAPLAALFCFTCLLPRPSPWEGRAPDPHARAGVDPQLRVAQTARGLEDGIDQGRNRDLNFESKLDHVSTLRFVIHEKPRGVPRQHADN